MCHESSSVTGRTAHFAGTYVLRNCCPLLRVITLQTIAEVFVDEPIDVPTLLTAIAAIPTAKERMDRRFCASETENPTSAGLHTLNFPDFQVKTFFDIS